MNSGRIDSAGLATLAGKGVMHDMLVAAEGKGARLQMAYDVLRAQLAMYADDPHARQALERAAAVVGGAG